MRSLRLLSALLVLALGAGACSKDNPVSGDQAGSIRGRVVLRGSTSGVPGVTVTTIPATQSVVTDSTGAYSLATVAPGSYSVSAKLVGYSTGSATVTVVAGQPATADLTIAAGSDGDSLRAPSRPYPSDGTAGLPQVITLSWSPAAPAASGITYDVFFGKNPAPPLVSSATTDTTLLRSGLDTGIYYWRVVARDLSGTEKSSPVWSFRTGAFSDNNAPELPSSPSPLSGATSVPYSVNLQWNCSDSDGDALLYDLYLGTATTPTELIGSGLTVSRFAQSGLQPGRTYYWRVVARDSRNGVTEGPVWSFTVKANRPPNKPNTPVPGDGAINQGISTTLRWNATDDDGDNLLYDVYFGTTSAATDLVASDIKASQLVRSRLQPGTTYYWRVVAKDSANGVAIGPIWSFTTVHPITTGLVAHYRLDGDATDFTENGHDGVLNGPRPTSDRFGLADAALSFDGNDFIQVPHSSSLNFDNSGTSFTVAAWVRFSVSHKQYSGIVAKGPENTSYPGYMLVLLGENVVGGAVGEPGAIVVGGTSALNDDSWHFVAMVVNAETSEMRIFVDGEMERSAIKTGVDFGFENQRPLFIGVERNGDNFFTGSIDDVRIFDRALSDQEIANLARQ